MASEPDQFTNSVSLLRRNNPKRRNLDDLETSSSGYAKLWGSRRLMVSTFMFFGYFYMFVLKGNLSIAIVEMTSNKTIIQGNQTIVKEPEFEWDSKVKGWMLSLLSYGSFFAAFGGYLSSKYGGVRIAGLGILFTALLTVLSPIAIRTNLYLFAVGRFSEGVLENFAYTGICDVWSRWIPKDELVKVVSFSHTGYYVAAAVTFPVCGLLAEYCGWPMIFYFTGCVATLWSLLLLKYVQNDPIHDDKMSIEELRHIKKNAKHMSRKSIIYPWRKIFTSKPVWALCFNKFAYCWAHITLTYSFPLYIKDITNESTAVVGILSGVPNYINLIVAPSSGLFLNYLQNNRDFNTSKLHKQIITSGFSVGGLLLAVVGFSNFTISMICFILIVILLSINFNILQITVVTMSPNHAGFVAGISAQWYSLSAALSSSSVGLIVTNHAWKEWSMCFGLSGGILMFAALLNALFGSSDDQEWCLIEDRNKHEQAAVTQE